jgi:hypothetical protein
MFQLHTLVYNAHMGTQQVKAWVCDKCGHIWIASDLVPTHCASSKCRSRQWNQRVDSMREAQVEARSRIASGEDVIAVADKFLKAFDRFDHDPKTCRIYKCGMCAAAKG